MQLTPQDKRQQIFMKGIKKPSGSLVDENAVGAVSSLSQRQFETNDARKIFLDTVSGNDANSGLTELLPKLTYSAAAALVDSVTRFCVEVINDGAIINDALTVPTQMKLGVTGTLYGLQSFVGSWTAAGTPSYGGTDINAVCYSTDLSKYLSVGDSGKVAYSSDGNVWTQAATPAVAVNVTTDCCYAGGSIDKFIIVSESGEIAYSSDGNIFTLAGTPSFGGTAVRGVCYSSSLAKLIAVGSSGKIAYSTDGNTWTQAATPSFGTTIIRKVCFSESLGLFVAVGSSGKIAYSTDGNVWTQAATPSFGTDIIYDVAFNESLGLFVAVGASNKTAYSEDGDTWTQIPFTFGVDLFAVDTSSDGALFVAVGGNRIYFCSNPLLSSNAWTRSSVDTSIFGVNNLQGVCYNATDKVFCAVSNGGIIAESNDSITTIDDNVAGFEIGFTGLSLSTSVTDILIYNNTFNCLFTATNPLQLIANRFEAGLTITENSFYLQDNLIIGNVTLNAVPSTPDDCEILNNTIIGNIEINNTAADQDGFKFQDNIIEGNITADASFTISSGNIRGSVTNGLVAEYVTSDNPNFIDETDYKLQREVLGYEFDSAMCKASIYSVREDGIARDLGCYNVDDSQVIDTYTESRYLTKPLSIRLGDIYQSRILQGKNGQFSAYNDIKMLGETVTLNWQGLSYEDFLILKRFSSTSNQKVFLSLFPFDQITLSDLTLSANVALGDIVLEIDAKNIYGGDIITVNGVEYSILYGVDAENKISLVNCVKIVLNKPAEFTAVTNDTLARNYPKTMGEYFIDLPSEREIELSDNSFGKIISNLQIKLVKVSV